MSRFPGPHRGEPQAESPSEAIIKVSGRLVTEFGDLDVIGLRRGDVVVVVVPRLVESETARLTKQLARVSDRTGVEFVLFGPDVKLRAYRPLEGTGSSDGG